MSGSYFDSMPKKRFLMWNDNIYEGCLPRGLLIQEMSNHSSRLHAVPNHCDDPWKDEVSRLNLRQLFIRPTTISQIRLKKKTKNSSERVMVLFTVGITQVMKTSVYNRPVYRL